uniref:Uncharacterized protein n=1 Tax=Arundo donax TaxID=35708 RepID=A0A0A9ERF7_ARUDO
MFHKIGVFLTIEDGAMCPCLLCLSSLTKKAVFFL